MPRPERKAERFFPYTGGWNDNVPNLLLDPQQMTRAENIEYGQGGSRRKRGGTAKVNSTALESGADIMGGSDYRQTSSNTITQAQVVHVGTKAKKYHSASFSDIKTGLEAGKIPSYVVFNGQLLFTSNSDTDTPQVLANPSDASTSNLTGSFNNYAFWTVHRNRIWGAGYNNAPSTVDYCKANDETQWNADDADAGTIVVDPGDGDRITGFAGGVHAYLIVFKERSYHIISGSSASDFARTPRRLGVGSVNHNSIVAVENDVFFVSKYGIHSLATTEKYGDLETAFLSYPIRTTFNNLKNGSLNQSWGVNDALNNRVIWSFTNGGSTENDIILVYDYREKKWSKWIGPKPACLFSVDSTTGDEIWLGDYSGFAQKMNQTTQDDAGTAYTAAIAPGFIIFDDPARVKRYRTVYTHLKSTGDDVTLTYEVDGRSSSVMLTPAASGGVWGTDTWGNFSWGGSTIRSVSTRIDEVGRSLKLVYTQGGGDEDMELYGTEVTADILRRDYSLV